MKIIAVTADTPGDAERIRGVSGEGELRWQEKGRRHGAAMPNTSN
jgi:hypothetical protein